MKSKIAIIILSIISLVLIFLLIYQRTTYVKIPSQYKCEIVTEEDNTKFKQIILININKEQYVENYQNKNVTIYSDIDQYNSIKEIPNTEEVTYNFDDKNQTVTAEYKINELTDLEGNQINLWYKEYIKNIELSGYNCKITK